MSDFFTRLAERTLGLAPLLQPIIAPLFAQEMQQEDVEPFAAEVEGTTSAMTYPSVLAAAQHIQPPLSTQKESMESSAKELLYSDMTSSSAEQVIGATSTDSASLQVPTVAGVEPFALQPLEMENQSNTGSASARPVLQTPQHDEPQPTVDAKFIAPDSVNVSPTVGAKFIAPNLTIPHSIPPHPATNEHDLPLVAMQPQREAAAPLPQQIISSSQRGDIPVFPTREIQHFKETRLVAPATAIAPTLPVTSAIEPTTPLPTIQVTIGRIEVRATPPAAPTGPLQRQRTEPVVKSLDDYLRQRTKGGR